MSDWLINVLLRNSFTAYEETISCGNIKQQFRESHRMLCKMHFYSQQREGMDILHVVRVQQIIHVSSCEFMQENDPSLSVPYCNSTLERYHCQYWRKNWFCARQNDKDFPCVFIKIE